MSEITIPVIVKNSAFELDNGGAASIGGRVREMVSEHVSSLAFDGAALESAVGVAADILKRAVDAVSLKESIVVESMSLQLGITASGSVGIMGTGAQLESSATFEITFRITEI